MKVEDRSLGSEITVRSVADSAGRLLLAAARVHAYCLLPFLRHSFGANMPSNYGAFCVLLLLGVYVTAKSVAMLAFLVLWLLVLFCQRVWAAMLEQQGCPLEDTDGCSWLAMLLSNGDTKTIAKDLEPWVCLVAGCLLTLDLPAVGYFVALGGLSLSVVRIADGNGLNQQETQ